MSSDGYFEDDDFDDAVLQQLDKIEASQRPPTREPSFEVDDFTFGDIDESELARLDTFIEDTYQGKAPPVAGPSRTTSRTTLQTTLYGEVLPPPPPKVPRTQIQRTKSTPRNPFGQQAPKTKKWDHTEFAKSGWKGVKSRGKGKTVNDEDEEEQEAVEFEQFPAPFMPRIPSPSMKLRPDLLEAKHWIYPLNQPKRDYQYNIVKHCLFDNTIVALPTGLGKTFVAGVVMLNFYRWFPEGKVVFVAPTKPLVAQQIDACHKTCGIPGSDAIELTGQNPKPMRARAWKEKRVFYMTPQTLINDLVSENCDAGDIVLLVIDEAHRATGGYAYNQVVRFMMAKNPHFRVLALTATPGGDPNAVQALIDGLHISRIEIRDENSLDLKAYIHEKKVEQHIIVMSEAVNRIKDPLVTLMNSILKPLKERGLMYPSADPIKMHSFSANMKIRELRKDQGWAYTPLNHIGSLARAMGYLIEGTIGMCSTYMHELARDKDDDAEGKKKAGKKLRDNPLFRPVLKELELQSLRGFPMHPKMERLKALAVQHFANKLDEDGQEAEETKVMVFVTFREAVDEIVDTLNLEKPLIRANKFIGQGTDKQGKKGLAQKEQLEVIKKFKDGEYNVLVATSIGEEGLDIGEVDLIICYDAQKTPIRMLQRFGRTGRKREGMVHVLLAEGREEENMHKAKVTYKEVQKTIVRGDQLELYGDVERLLPDHIKPEPLEKAMEIQEYVREEGRKKRAGSKERLPKGTKRKRNDDASRNIPDGASTSFVTASKLLVKGGSKRKKVAKDFDQAGQDDDTDMEIESGIVGLTRRAASAASSSKPTAKAKSKLRRSVTDGDAKRKKKIATPTLSQFMLKAVDDEEDMEIERGAILTPSRSSPMYNSSLERPQRHLHSKSPSGLVVIDSDSDDPPGDSILTRDTAFIHPFSRVSSRRAMAWLIDKDDDPDIEIVDSSPMLSRRSRNSPSPALSDDSVCVVVEAMSSKSSGKRRAITPIEDNSVEFVERVEQDPNESVELVSEAPQRMARPTGPRKPDMPPPELPSRFLVSRSPPEPSFPVRGPGRARSRPVPEPESPAMEMPPPSQRRLHRRESPAKETRHRPKKSHKTSAGLKIVYDNEAVHSGDEISEGSSGGSDVESESDRQFLEGLPETQMSPSYDQSLAYRQSLLTQAHGGGRIPNFVGRPARKGMFGGGPSESSRRRPQVSSSPPPEPDAKLDAYELGNFVVDDDEDISFLSSET
ncbi:hypothetical protein DFH07DRAFT_726924 [Mycena maculata]|uniref:ATP-dependent DNA helicase n=1 Tax=Mycena maculata TaxID=230809 RepID=A0AAD7KE55_9AGAR|nr:hypothetical protein DFH07DRAFT_726924 [Mycena maculata]